MKLILSVIVAFAVTSPIAFAADHSSNVAAKQETTTCSNAKVNVDRNTSTNPQVAQKSQKSSNNGSAQTR